MPLVLANSKVTISYQRKPSNFNPTIANSTNLVNKYDYQSAILQGIIPSSFENIAKFKFVTYYADLIIEGFNFTEYEFSDNISNSLILALLSPQKGVTISNCAFILRQMIFMTTEGANFKLQNSIVDVSKINRLFYHSNDQNIELFMQDGLENNITIQNNTFYGQNHESGLKYFVDIYMGEVGQLNIH
ncbi:UNKNOWN [Stylonychia lemnae]|uniref:Uncharacterized protein n=1 Tax=Stylonychia lemnae TaxID=5949 RepID=A0A077ZY75_STYLE|nr:UNKNOWN [Stylonychia lemnae]|eukprot:CDW74831.1 UNKNOWN [Stylonychia lemnae]